LRGPRKTWAPNHLHALSGPCSQAGHIRPPLDTARLASVHFKNVDGVGELDVELEECDRELALRLALAIRLGIARVVWLNLARVDVRRSGAGAEGYHDLILDAGGGAAFVGEVKVRNISARNGAVFEPHYQGVLRGVQRDYDEARAKFGAGHDDKSSGHLLFLCTLNKRIGHAAVHVSGVVGGQWLSLHDWPGLPGAVLASNPPQGLLGPPLPSLAQLLALAQPAFRPAANATQPANAIQPVGAALVLGNAPAAAALQLANAMQPAGAALALGNAPSGAALAPALVPAALHATRVPPRQDRPPRRPRTWDAAFPHLTKFRINSAGAELVLVQDFLNVLHQDSKHTRQNLQKWRAPRGIPCCRDPAHAFPLVHYTGVSGKNPWAASLTALEAVFDKCYQM
jgi:hypothetical protein